jgi:tRNA(Ile2) C34 agmatinyltransferase TiaS
VTPPQKPKSHLEAHAPQCARCRTLMKVRILIPGRKVDDVAYYRCEKCGGEVRQSVPRAR